MRGLLALGVTLALVWILVNTFLLFALRDGLSVAKDILLSVVQEGIPTVMSRAEQTTATRPAVPYWVHPPVYRGTAFAFSPERPTLIVLLHGATRPSTPEGTVGTLAGARAYWGFDYVASLLGSRELETFSGVPLSGTTWRTAALEDAVSANHLIRARNVPGNRYVMLTYRDGSDYLGPQTVAALTQIERLYQEAARQLRDAPQLVLLGHSMGGLVSRYILSNPQVRAPNFALSSEARAKADFVRDRTLYLITEATPHLGSLAADHALLIESLTSFSNTLLERWNITLSEDDLELHRTLLGFLRPYQGSTQHLRRDVLAELNRPGLGLLSPDHARRSDGSLVPVYTLSGRSPAGGSLDNPNVDMEAELSLIGLEGKRLGVGSKFLVDTLSMIFTDYVLYNFPGLASGWGDVPPGLEALDRVRRFSLFQSQMRVGQGAESVGFGLETFPTYYLTARWESDAPLSNPVHTLEAWLEKLVSPETRDIEPFIERDETADLDTLRARYAGSDALYQRSSGAVGDGFIDSDGVVSLDSGLGLFLGSQAPEYFSHERLWSVGTERVRGSWYRIYDGRYPRGPAGTFPWEWGNHAFMQYSGATGRWLAQTILDEAGPYVGPASISSWRFTPKESAK